MSIYFLESLLPSLTIQVRPSLLFEEFIFYAEQNLRSADLQQILRVRLLVDVLNIRSLFGGGPIDRRGNLQERELEQALLLREWFPESVFEVLEKSESDQDKLRHFSAVVSAFLYRESEELEGFLNYYFLFEWELRLVLAALRAGKIGRNFATLFQFEEASNPVVADILAQESSGRYEPPLQFAKLKNLIDGPEGNPESQYKAFIVWKFMQIEEMNKEPFSIDQILAYMIQLMLIEDWHALDEGKGITVLKALVG
jgi:hypothetical protein